MGEMFHVKHCPPGGAPALEATRFMTSQWPTLALPHEPGAFGPIEWPTLALPHEPGRLVRSSGQRWHDGAAPSPTLQGRVARRELWHQLVSKPVPRTGNVGGFALVWNEWRESPNFGTRLVPERSIGAWPTLARRSRSVPDVGKIVLPPANFGINWFLKPVPRTGNVGGFALVWNEWRESPKRWNQVIRSRTSIGAWPNVGTARLIPEMSQRCQPWRNALVPERVRLDGQDWRGPISDTDAGATALAAPILKRTNQNQSTILARANLLPQKDPPCWFARSWSEINYRIRKWSPCAVAALCRRKLLPFIE